MKKLRITLLVAVAAGLAGTALYLYHKKNTRKKLAIISDAGYETAQDIHFPIRYRGKRKQNF